MMLCIYLFIRLDCSGLIILDILILIPESIGYQLN